MSGKLTARTIAYKGHQIEVEEDGDITVWELTPDGTDIIGHFLVGSLKEAREEITQIARRDREYAQAQRILR
jgi:hypothetical protein|tara:strand:- start:10 stop:225 length:216 start_codon:yes stop_codon:yes gene_type:complete